MTEEEYFIKNYPDFCYYDKPLSPYWDLFQYGVEFGERQSEEKIEELKHNKKTVVHLADCLEEKMKERIEELEKENKELKNFINAPLTKGRKTTRKEFYQAVWDLSKQLTKATDIIKGLLSCCRNYPQENAEKVKQAEQFLKK